MTDENASAPTTDAPPTDAPKRAPKRDKNAKMRAAIAACKSMEQIADVLGVGGKTVFRPWVRANIAHFGTDTHALLTGKSTPKGASKAVPNVSRIVARFVDGDRSA